jgi:ATP-dependent exoDNAse (exonuclease V) beta subunit
VAVLVRARSHLASLLPTLRRERVPFAAIELDRLSQRQSVVDLTALAHALLQPCDRLSWLAVLRALWCGLTLGDLLAVSAAAGTTRNGALPRVFDELDAIAGLSDDGRSRLRRVADVLRAALASRGEAGVAQRIRGAWLALGGPACLDDPLDLDAAALFFELLAAHERGGDLPDWEAFLAALASLHASPAAATGGVQLMTMHKAKGLEFDTVILSGLASEGRKPDPPLLRWRRRDAGLLIAPARPRGGDEDPLYRHLGRLDADEEDAELGRLLYVACTRAKVRLHLLAAPGTCTDKDTGALSWKPPAAGSSLEKLAVALEAGLPLMDARDDARPAGSPAPPLRRLRSDIVLAAPQAAIPVSGPAASGDTVTPEFDWVRETTRRIGTLAHRLLARIAEDGLDAWPAQRVETLARRVQAELVGAGLSPAELPAATDRVLRAIRRTLDDPQGRWLFDPAHEDAHSEWPLSGVDEGGIAHIVVDRTFVAGGVRWIVDFKTGAHEGGDAATFLDREVERYRGQLARYARMLQRLDPRPVRMALYYPLIDNGFREIGPAAPAAPPAAMPGRQLGLFDAPDGLR